MQIIKILIITALLLPVLSFSQTTESDDAYSVQDFKIDDLKVDKGYLDAWGISLEEYKRFIYLKRNTPRGVITPQANPLYYLGLEARTAEERTRFAQKVAQMEFENAEKGREWREAVQIAAARLYGRPDIVDLSIGDELNRKLEAEYNRNKTPSKLSVLNNPNEVIKVFMDFDCPECDKAYSGALSDLVTGKHKRVEVVFKRGSDDLDIKKWATRVGVPIELNKRGVVELRQAYSDEKVDSYPTVKFGGI